MTNGELQQALAHQPTAIHTSHESPSREERDQDMHHIREALRGLRYGSVNIIIQDGVVVQIDRTEKRRVRQRTGK